MTLRLYMDHHVDARVTAGLLRRGIDVVTAAQDNAQQLDDPALLDRATALARVLVSQDADLRAEADRRISAGVLFAGLVYGSRLSGSVGASIRDLELLSLCCEPGELHNRIEFLPLR